MLHPDVVELRRFYSSPLGVCVRRDLGAAILRYWHDADDVTLAGLGFSLPYLRQFLEPARHVVPVMFPHLGAMYWPADISNHAILATENALPFQDHTIGRLLVCHCAEHSHHFTTLMQEIYRVLLPGGRALFVVPNRRGLWSSRHQNPFGSGHPYTVLQMRHRAELAGLTFIRSTGALFYPPSNWRLVTRLSGWIEAIGRVLAPQLGGALLVEVEKQLYASIPDPVKKPVRAPLPIPQP